MANLSKPGCMKCSKFLMCHDPYKGPRYSCDNFVRLKEVGGHVADLGETDMVPRGELYIPLTNEGKRKNKKAKGNKGELSANDVIELEESGSAISDDFVFKAMQNAFDAETNTVRDLKIDDQHLPWAKNFYDYCSRVVGKDVNMPFARQLHICMWALGEVCPRCTHANARDMYRIPVDLDPHLLARKMTFLEHGICPKCHVTKYELVVNKEIKDYTSLILVLGQRSGKCVVGSTQVLTEHGPSTFAKLAKLHSDTKDTFGYTKYKGPRLVNENGSFVMPSEFFRAEPELLYKVTTLTNQIIEGTPEHPIWTAGGWIKLKDLKVGTTIPVKIGQNAWGDEIDLLPYQERSKDWKNNLADGVVKKAHKKVVFNARTLTPKIAGMIGYWVAEGSTESPRHFKIHNHDQEVNRYCHEALNDLISGIHFKHEVDTTEFRTGVGFANAKAAYYLNSLLDNQLSEQVRSASKFIPDLILKSPKECVQEFLRCAFEGDGGLNGVMVEYSSLSEKLARQIQILLLNLGVPCSLGSGKTWASNGSTNQIEKTAYFVHIKGKDSKELFQQLVGFKSERKKALLAKSVVRGSRRSDPSEMGYVSKEIQEKWTSLIQSIWDVVHSHTHTDRFNRVHPYNFRYLGIDVGSNRLGNLRLTKYKISAWISKFKATVAYDWISQEQKDALADLERRANDKNIFWTSIKKIERTSKKPTYDVSIPDGHRFMANGLLNHNSTITAVISTYVFHCYLKSPRLSSVAQGIQTFSPLTGTFVALTTTNAIKLLWNPVREMMVASSWYQEYFDTMKHIGKRYGKEIVQFNPTGLYLRAFHKGLDVNPAGPSKRGLRGPTRFLAATDELGFFPFDISAGEDEEMDEERERANADETYTVLSNSLTTIRGAVLNLYSKNIYTFPQALNLGVSSPSNFRDKVMRLYAESQHPDSDSYGVRAPTWEITPFFPRDHPVIQSAYRTNPRKAERDYGANPPSLTSSVFSKEQIHDIFKLEPLASLQYENTKEYTCGKLVEVKKPAKFSPSLLSIDAGETDNAFAVTLITSDGPIIKVPIILELVPAPGTRINFVKAYADVIKPIIMEYNVREVYADQWQSTFILQQIEADFPEGCAHGHVIARKYSLKGSDFTAFINFVHTGQLQLTKLEMEIERIEAVVDFKKELLYNPSSHLCLQFLTVQQTGEILVKGPNNTDDILRSLILGTTRMFDIKIAERMRGYKTVDRSGIAPDAMIFSSGRSGINLQQSFLYGNAPRQIL